MLVSSLKKQDLVKAGPEPKPGQVHLVIISFSVPCSMFLHLVVFHAFEKIGSPIGSVTEWSMGLVIGTNLYAEARVF